MIQMFCFSLFGLRRGGLDGGVDGQTRGGLEVGVEGRTRDGLEGDDIDLS